MKEISWEEKILWNNQAQSYRNPMQNLFSAMHQAVANMGVAKYYEVLTELDKAKEIMCKALDQAQLITYDLDE